MKRSLFWFLLLCSLASRSQVTTFETEYPIWNESALNNFMQTSDGGYILSTDAVPEQDTAVSQLGYGYLVKIDAQGNTQWIKSYPKTTFFVKSYDGCSVIQTNDGGYIIATVKYEPTYSEIILIKTDSSGNCTWSKAYPGYGASVAFCIKQTSDLGFIVCGSTVDTLTANNYAYLVKTDNSGNLQWGKAYAENPGGQSGQAYCVNQTADGGYILVGNSWNGAFIMKTDNSGAIVWDHNFGMPGSDGLRCVKQTSNGGYIATGYGVANSIYTTVLLKYDSIGTAQWENAYPSSTSSYDEGIAVTEVTGGYTVLQRNSYTSTSLFHTDVSGHVQWQTNNYDNMSYAPSALDLTADGGYAYTAAWGAPMSNHPGVGVIKTDSMGLTSCHDSLSVIADTVYSPPTNPGFIATTIGSATNIKVIMTAVILPDSTWCREVNPKGIDDIASENNVSVFPNPSSGNFSVEVNSLKGNSIHIEVYDMLGQLMMEKKEENVSGDFRENLDLSAMSDGIYFVWVKVGDRILIVKKLVKEK